MPANNMYVRQQLRKVREAAYMQQYPELKGRQLLAVDRSVSAGAVTYSYDVITKHGAAALSTDLASEGPRVDAAVTEVFARTYHLTDSYGYSLSDMEAAQESGRDLRATRAIAAKEAIMQLFDRLMLIGASSHNIAGLFGLSGGVTYTPPADGTGSSALWSAKVTADNKLILRDLHGMVSAITNGSNDVESPDTLVLPSSRYDILNNTYFGADTTKTLLQVFLESSDQVNTVVKSLYLEPNAGHGGGSSARAMMYNKSKEKIRAIVPLEFQQIPEQWNGFKSVTNCRAKYGGIELPFPKSVAYADGI